MAKRNVRPPDLDAHRSEGNSGLNGDGRASARGARPRVGVKLADRLRESILSGALPPGSKINLEQLRQAEEISLSPLREALTQLVALRLVDFEENRGYTVSPISLTNLAEITQLRIAFERMALSAAIGVGDLDWEGRIVGSLHRLSQTNRDPSDLPTLDAWERAHRDFHMALIGGCGLPLLLQFCLTLHNLNDRYRRILLMRGGGDRDIGAEHASIAKAAIGRDVASATTLLSEHIQRTGANLHAALSLRLVHG